MNCRLQLIRFYETIGLVISPGVRSKALLSPPMSGECKAGFGQRYDVTQWFYRVKKCACEPHQGFFLLRSSFEYSWETVATIVLTRQTWLWRATRCRQWLTSSVDGKLPKTARLNSSGEVKSPGTYEHHIIDRKRDPARSTDYSLPCSEPDRTWSHQSTVGCCSLAS